MKTGQCKFGSACKFHHPQPLPVNSSVPSPAYTVVQPPLVPSPQQYPSLASWQVGGPTVPPTSYMPGSYGPMLISPSIIPVPGWSPYAVSVFSFPWTHHSPFQLYNLRNLKKRDCDFLHFLMLFRVIKQPPVNSALSPSGQQIIQAGVSYGLLYQSSPTSAHPGPYPPISSSPGYSSIQQKENKLPERPGQPICQYYMKVGVCKFGTMCKYHHPPARRTPYSNCMSAFGLPLRPV